MITVQIKPLSVNEAWKGRRFKTDKYKQYERDLTFMLPKLSPGKPPYIVFFEFGFSNHAQDIDNSIKPTLDILQAKYKFNDRDIEWLMVKKVVVGKGQEYIKFILDGNS